MSSASTSRPVARFVPALATMLLLTGVGSASAQDAWSLRLGLSWVEPSGHDPEVLRSSGAGGQESFSLDTESGPGYQFGVRWDPDARWSAGADFRWFTGAQKLQLATRTGGAGAPETFGITERSFTSTGPGQVLYFRRVGDTDMNAWTFDLYARRRLSSGSRGDVRLLFGLRNADFDNDNRFAAGIEGMGGTRLDASSNYDRMIGPLVGLVWERASDRHAFEVMLGLSVVTGDVELSSSLTDFSGPFDPVSVNVVGQEAFSRTESVTIPIGELRGRWSYAATERIGFGVELGISRWNDVSVPPGVRPGGRLETLYETSITFAEAVASLEIDL